MCLLEAKSSENEAGEIGAGCWVMERCPSKVVRVLCDEEAMRCDNEK